MVQILAAVLDLMVTRFGQVSSTLRGSFSSSIKGRGTKASDKLEMPGTVPGTMINVLQMSVLNFLFPKRYAKISPPSLQEEEEQCCLVKSFLETRHLFSSQRFSVPISI